MNYQDYFSLLNQPSHQIDLFRRLQESMGDSGQPTRIGFYIISQAPASSPTIINKERVLTVTEIRIEDIARNLKGLSDWSRNGNFMAVVQKGNNVKALMSDENAKELGVGQQQVKLKIKSKENSGSVETEEVREVEVHVLTQEDYNDLAEFLSDIEKYNQSEKKDPSHPDLQPKHKTTGASHSASLVQSNSPIFNDSNNSLNLMMAFNKFMNKTIKLVLKRWAENIKNINEKRKEEEKRLELKKEDAINHQEETREIEKEAVSRFNLKKDVLKTQEKERKQFLS
jgi:hypothetical protein